MDASFVTILFTDLVGSTAEFDRRGDDAADAWRREQFAALRNVIADRSGRVEAVLRLRPDVVLRTS